MYRWVVILLTFGLFSCQDSVSYFFYVSSADADYPAGIARMEIDQDGKLSKHEEFYPPSRSGYLALTEDNQHVYSVSGDSISSFLVEPTGTLSFLNRVPAQGSAACYVSVSNDQKYVLTANYMGGNLVVTRRLPDGGLGEVSDTDVHHGGSVNKKRQEEPHPHMIRQAPSSNLVFATDLGNDRLYAYVMDDDGKIHPAPNPWIRVEAGAGPRHFTFHPEKDFLFLLNELNATISSYRYDDSGISDIIDTQELLPADFTDFNKSADLSMTPDGKFLFASNRGHESITVFMVTPDGLMEKVGNYSCGGSWPRAISVDPSGKFLLVANRRSHNLVSFSIDPKDGHLEKVDELTSFPDPICIKFMN